MIADIAAVFHWSLSDLKALELADLLDWHRRAITRWKIMNKVESSP